jgi:putative transcriptional regulator
VVLVSEHNDEGAMGVILNRPSGMTVADAAPELESIVGAETAIFAGGPVQPTAGLVLAEVEHAEDPIFAEVVLLPDLDELTSAAEEADRLRVFAGYAGWGPGQLDEELDRDDWIVEPARPEDVFGTDPEALWVQVLTRKGGQYALVARMPEDPSLN